MIRPDIADHASACPCGSLRILQKHGNEQPGGLPETKGKPGTAELSATDDCVCDYYTHIINKGNYHADARKPYATAIAKSQTRYVTAGDEHSSHSDEELITALPHSYFKPVKT